MISFCTTIKNRSRVVLEDRELSLFPNCVRSIRDSLPSDIEAELVVTDWHSDDWPLQDWLSELAAPLPVKIISIEGPFSRGRGLNLAAQAARGDLLFFLDVDVLLSPELIEACVKWASADHAYFPQVYAFDDPEHLSGHWNDFGYGHCAIKKAIFEQTSGWPEYKTWGSEDDHFYADVASKVPILRECVTGFFHQWHPNDLLWKNRYSERHAAMAEEFQQRAEAVQELSDATPAGSRLILVDEARFGSDPLPSRCTYPFTELDGEYNGPPADSEAAIQELERLRKKGAQFIAFAWMSFWWLEHYPEFANYLKSKFALVLKNERLLVFQFNEAPMAHSDVMDQLSELAEEV